MNDNQLNLPEPLISIFFENKEYAVDMAAYQTSLIGLPDGRILQSDGWLESYPPQPGQLTIVEHTNMENVIFATFVGEKNSDNAMFFE